MKKILPALLCAAAALCCLLAGCAEQASPQEGPAPLPAANTVNAGVDLKQFRQPASDALVAEFATSAGSFAAVLYPDAAPQAVQNFVTLARAGSYDGLDFHRVIKDFIVQSGDTDGAGGTSIWGSPFAAETSDLLHHYTGALAMAGADENHSQFFVVNCTPDSVPTVLCEQMRQLGWDEKIIAAYSAVGGAPYLDGSYTVFGQVIWGMDTVRAIGATAGEKDAPTDPVQLQQVSITSFAAWQKANPKADLDFYDPAADSERNSAAE